MARTVGIGLQDFGDLCAFTCCHAAAFVPICAGKRYGNKYEDGGSLFEGLDIWKEEKYRELQGTYPVISLSFANVKEKDCQAARIRICQLPTELYEKNN